MSSTGSSPVDATASITILLLFWFTASWFIVPRWRERRSRGYVQIQERLALWTIAASIFMIPLAFLGISWISSHSSPIYMGSGAMAHTTYWLLCAVIVICIAVSSWGVVLLHRSRTFNHAERIGAQGLTEETLRLTTERETEPDN